MWFKENVLGGFYFNNAYILCYDENFSSIQYSKNKDVSKLEEFLPLLRQFIVDTNFDDFFLKNRDLYNKIITENNKNLGSRDFSLEYEKIYGIKLDNLVINIKPIQSDWGEFAFSGENGHVYNVVTGVVQLKDMQIY